MAHQRPINHGWACAFTRHDAMKWPMWAQYMLRASCIRRCLSSGSGLVLPSCISSSWTAGGTDDLALWKGGGERHEEEAVVGCPLWAELKPQELSLSLSCSKSQLSILTEREINKSKSSGSSRGVSWSLTWSAKSWRKASHKEEKFQPLSTPRVRNSIICHLSLALAESHECSSRLPTRSGLIKEALQLLGQTHL